MGDAVVCSSAATGWVRDELLSRVDEQCTQVVSGAIEEARPVGGKPLGEQLAAPLEKSMEELNKYLKSYGENGAWTKRCGLTMVTADDGTTEWVLPEDVAAFKSKHAISAASVHGNKGGGGGSSSSAQPTTLRFPRASRPLPA